MCNKISFDSEQETIDYIILSRNINPKRGRFSCAWKLRPYFCSFCNKWHTTSQKKLKYKIN